jgi:hypothetical protein
MRRMEGSDGMMILAVLAIGGVPDFSRAGCDELPRPRQVVSVLDFGAVADDETGDASAIQAAIDSVADSGGQVQIPAGRWVLDAPLRVSTSGVRICGDAGGGTVLHCPKPLAELRGPHRRWSWSGGMLELSPRGTETVLATVIADAADGATSLDVAWSDDHDRPRVGDWVQVRWYNDRDADTLLHWLYGGVIDPADYGSELQASQKPRVVSWAQVMSMDRGRVEIDPPLPAPIRSAWKVELLAKPHLLGCEVRGVTFDFPITQYPGHLKERGFNAIAGNGLVHCNLTDITINNADSGILLGKCGFTTLRDIAISGRKMHHPISLSWCSNCLVEDFSIEAPHVHGTTLSWSSHYNVFHRGSGQALAMDCHRACSFRNLHQDMVVDQGRKLQQPLRSGGAKGRGPHAARENVYWNIEFRFEGDGPPFQVSRLSQWPLGTFVGWHGNRDIDMSAARKDQTVTLINERPRPGPWASNSISGP